MIGLRPENITEPRNRPDAVEYLARVELVEPLGVETLIYFSIAGTQVCARIDPFFAPRPGETMPVSLDMGRMHLIETETGRVVPAS
jgi:multiple sugar transport system ATP-binding protein